LKPFLSKYAGPAGCAVVGIALVVVLVRLLGAWLLWFIAAVVILIVVAIVRDRWRLRGLVRNFRQATGGKDMLVVYTASPHWQPRIESDWKRRWGHRAVFFNRSEPWSRDQPEAQLWAQMRGITQHTPLVLVATPKGLTTVPFFLAFRDFKHGKEAALLEAEAEVDATLADVP
jgi:hypothetical protein